MNFEIWTSDVQRTHKTVPERLLQNPRKYGTLSSNMILTATSIIIAILIILVLALGTWLFLVERRLRKLLSGKNAQSLEGLIAEIGSDIRALLQFQTQATARMTDTEKRLKRSIQGVETIRFNAFKGNGEGGNQSFAVALLSEEGNGVVFSSLYTRDQVRVFAKQIKNFTSEHELSVEEKDVVARTRRPQGDFGQARK